MRAKIYYLLPILMVTVFSLCHLNVLHISYLHIKSHELKFTELSYSWFPKGDDIFTAGESVTNNNYEDGIIAFQPDYEALLQSDLDEIALYRNGIDRIDYNNLSYYSGPYRVQLCLDHKRVKYVDTTLFRMFAKVDILGQLEVYDESTAELVHFEADRKFWIRDSIIFRGWARRELINNKVNEIWMAQASDHVADVVERADHPRRYETAVSDMMQLISYNMVWEGDTITTQEALIDRARVVLFEIRRAYANGSPTYGWHGDPKYKQEAYGAYSQKEVR